jgi:hypothetical protein
VLTAVHPWSERHIPNFPFSWRRNEKKSLIRTAKKKGEEENEA